MKLEAVVLCLVFVLCCISVFADPETANVVEAQGGNITALIITSGPQGAETTRWQGYFGNITGGLTLNDGGNNTLYQWGIASPEGEVFASNSSSVTWANIDCVNFTTNTSVLKYNVSDLNEFIGYDADEQGADDTVNATFNQTFGDGGETFTVGSTTITNADNCSMVTLFDENGYQTSKFREVLLTDNHSIVFASILEQDVRGFNNQTTDFEMIVGVNESTVTRTYYFFVELS